MAIDIYIGNSDSPNFTQDIEINSDIESFIQQIEMILTTKKGSILGDSDFGVDLEYLLWNGFGNSNIETEINSQIIRYCKYYVNKIPYRIETNFIQKDEFNDILIVDVYIENKKALGIGVY